MTNSGFFVSMIAFKHSCLTDKSQNNHLLALVGNRLNGSFWPGAVLSIAENHTQRMAAMW
jgi:hypothetical protein